MNIFDVSIFMPRFMCINHDKVLAWLYVVPNLHTFLTYSFGFTLIYQLLKRKAEIAKLPFFPTLMWLYTIFFFFCGGTHFFDAIALWWPAYRFFILWEWLQSISAFFAFIYTIQLIKTYFYKGMTWKEIFLKK